MKPWLVAVIVAVSIAPCIFLWFRDVHRVMRERRSTVESAAGQLEACRERARKAHGAPETDAIVERSESIYRQSVVIYNRTLKRPWYYLPAHLMGYRFIE